MYLVQLFQGVGDTLSQKHFVKKLIEVKGEIGLFTVWPQFFHDVPGIHFWYQDTMLRTPYKNVRSLPDIWAPIHRKAQADLTIQYDDRQLAQGMTMAQSFAKNLHNSTGILVEDYSLDLALRDEWISEANKIIRGRPVCIIRVPTLRREWRANARNPKPGVMQEILKKLPKDIVKISVGYNEPNEEWPVDIIDVDEDYSSGQLSITTVAALMNRAKLTVCPVGYATLMSIAVKGKCLSVFGGHVGPSHIYDSRMDLRNHRYVAPDPFCDCFDLLHGCHKDINIDEGVVKMKELLNA